MIEEIWKPIIINEKKTHYEVSDQGNIRNIKTNKTFKKYINNRGYERVTISSDKKKYYKSVHRLVLITFDPIKNSNTFEIHHKDGNKKNNRLENLQWITSKDHILLEIKKGNNKVGKFGKNSLKFKGYIGQFTKDGILKNIIEGKSEMKLLNFSNTAIYQTVINILSTHKGFVFRRFPVDIKPEIGKKYDLFDPIFMQFFKTDSSKNINHSYKQLELNLI